jgi:hypothetical protein
MRASNSPLWRGAFFLLPACAAAWAAGCSDDTTTPSGVSPSPDASPDVSSPNAEGGAPTSRYCASDLDENEKIWKHLECSGLYASLASKTLASDVKDYKPGVEFWSDGAEKQRWVHLPDGAKIDISDWDEWSYPKGTKLWKEFKLGGKRIETRLFTKLEDGSWAHGTYRWNADETDAVLQTSGEKIPGLGPDGGIYEIPPTDVCDTCHIGRKDHVLGFDAVSLGLSTATGLTLSKLAEEGRLSASPPATALAFPSDSSGGGDKAAPAIGWLHANCGACHNGNEGAGAFYWPHFLVRASQLVQADGGAGVPVTELDVYTQAYCVDSTAQDPDTSASYKYLRGGDPAHSLMSILSGQRASPTGEDDTRQMPPIVTHAVDHAGHKLLDDWISVLPPCP